MKIIQKNPECEIMDAIRIGVGIVASDNGKRTPCIHLKGTISTGQIKNWEIQLSLQEVDDLIEMLGGVHQLIEELALVHRFLRQQTNQNKINPPAANTAT